MKEAIIQYNDTPSGGHLAISWKPLVRCKDCKHYDEQCQQCERIDGILLPDFFCADGERKSD